MNSNTKTAIFWVVVLVIAYVASKLLGIGFGWALLLLIGAFMVVVLWAFATRKKRAGSPRQVPPLKPTPASPNQVSQIVKQQQKLITTEQELESVLQRLHQELRARPDASLPVVSLHVKEILGKPRICWHFATGYDIALDVEAAERFLSGGLEEYGLKISGGDYMGDRSGNRYNFWDYVIKPQNSSTHEKEIEALDSLDREHALVKASELLAQGKLDVLIAWLRLGKYYGIPAELLAKSESADAAAAVIELLRDTTSEVRTRAAAALGPLGGVDAARALCTVLPGPRPAAEYWRLAGALERLAWPGAVESLTAAIEQTTDSSVRAALGRALVHSGGVDAALKVLYAGLADDLGSNDYASALCALDKDGIRDSRLVAEISALLERTSNNNSKQIAAEVLGRHKEEWEQGRQASKALTTRRSPTKRVEPFEGEVMYPVEEASAITGIPVDEIHKLIWERRVFSGQVLGSLRVSLNGSFPCGELVDHPDPRYRMIGAKQSPTEVPAAPPVQECGCLSQHAAFALATYDGPHKPCTVIASHCSDCQMMYQTVIIDGHVTRDTLIERSTRLACSRERAEQEFAGMLARARQIGYTGERLEQIILPDLAKKSKPVTKAASVPSNVSVSPPSAQPMFRAGGGQKDKVVFLRKRTQTGGLGAVTTYEEYKANSAATARDFLLTKQVKQPAYYIVVETTEGVWGMDVEGLYLERLADWQSDVALAEVEGRTGSGLPSLFGLRQAASGIIDNFIQTVVCGKCGQDWQDGLRYHAVTVVKCPKCGAKNSIDSSNLIVTGVRS